MQQTGLNPRATLVMKKRAIYDTFSDVRSYELHRLSIMTHSKTRIGLVIARKIDRFFVSS